MSGREYTSIGGDRQSFQTTPWTAIEEVRAHEGGRGTETSNRLVGELLSAYWKPVYCYLRRRGCDNEQAKDLTQDFFQEVVLGRELIRRADRTKGRFRTLLLRALDRYLISVHRKTTARKRLAPGRLIPLDDTDIAQLPETTGHLNSEELFHYTWISGLLDRMLSEVHDECQRRDMATHWALFHDRVLQPIMSGIEPPAMEELCRRYGVDAPTTASSMIFTVKRRFAAALKRILRQSVALETQIDEEMVDLMAFLTKGRQ